MPVFNDEQAMSKKDLCKFFYNCTPQTLRKKLSEVPELNYKTDKKLLRTKILYPVHLKLIGKHFGLY